jgi:hypothetical protein
MKITNQQTGRRAKFFRYDRMLLGDTLTEDKNGTLSLCSYKKFKEGLDTDDKTKSSLQPARDFIENLPFSSAEELDRLMGDLKFILEKLEQKTNIPIHPKS